MCKGVQVPKEVRRRADPLELVLNVVVGSFDRGAEKRTSFPGKSSKDSLRKSSKDSLRRSALQSHGCELYPSLLRGAVNPHDLASLSLCNQHREGQPLATLFAGSIFFTAKCLWKAALPILVFPVDETHTMKIGRAVLFLTFNKALV